MGFSIAEIWASMGLLAKLVVGVLGIMAVASAYVVVDRLVLLHLSRKRSRDFAEQLSRRVVAAGHREILDLAEKAPRAPLSQIVREGIRTFLRPEVQASKALAPSELARRAMNRRAEAVSSDLRRGLSVLASVGSVAPFVGLFGTVVGIINAFEGISASGTSGLAAVSAGIAEALIVTAFGLGVAIPAVLVFNSISTRVDRFELMVSSAGGEFADWLDAAGAPAPEDVESAAETDEAEDDAPDAERPPAPARDGDPRGDWA